MKMKVILLILLYSSSIFANYSDDKLAQLTYDTFNELRADNVEILDKFYADSILFEDPVGRIEGLSSMKAYYKEMYKSVVSIRFEFKPFSEKDGRYFFPWVMFLKTPKLNSGKEFSVVGGSEIHFKDGLVFFHRDYFDMGEFLYERLPVLGSLIKTIRKRLQVGH